MEVVMSGKRRLLLLGGALAVIAAPAVLTTRSAHAEKKGSQREVEKGGYGEEGGRGDST